MIHPLRLLATLIAAAFVVTNAARAANIVHGVKVVVIDPGHGGNDPGAHHAGVYEKDLTLKVALRLGRMIERGMPGVKVVYTRKTDKALAPTKIEDLQARADVANKAGGDLFVSIHVNAARSSAARGVETLVMGETPKEQRYNENALFENNRDDLIDMSDERTAAIVRAYIQNLQFTYGEFSMAMARCVQKNFVRAGRHSRGVKPQLLRVLYATDMPGVLAEIGFLSNAQEAAYLKSERGQEEIARSLFGAVKDYSAYVAGSRQAAEEAAAAERERSEEPSHGDASGTAARAERSAADSQTGAPAPSGGGAAARTSAPAAASGAAPAKPAAGGTAGASNASAPATAPVRPSAGGAAPSAAGGTPAKGAPAATPAKGSETTGTATAPARPQTGAAASNAGSASVSASGSATASASGSASAATPAPVRYAVQIMASSKVVPLTSGEFKNYRGRVKRYTAEGPYRYKYAVAESPDRQTALGRLKEVRKTFPKAFLIRVEGSRVVK